MTNRKDKDEPAGADPGDDDPTFSGAMLWLMQRTASLERAHKPLQGPEWKRRSYIAIGLPREEDPVSDCYMVDVNPACSKDERKVVRLADALMRLASDSGGDPVELVRLGMLARSEKNTAGGKEPPAEWFGRDSQSWEQLLAILVEMKAVRIRDGGLEWWGTLGFAGVLLAALEHKRLLVYNGKMGAPGFLDRYFALVDRKPSRSGMCRPSAHDKSRAKNVLRRLGLSESEADAAVPQ